jgi:subtilisin family serine protease
VSGPLDKLDSALWRIFNEYRESQHPSRAARTVGPAAPSPAYSLTLRYQGSLTEIEALGFRTTESEFEGFAHGTVQLDDLERIAAHPNVLSLSYGSAPELHLDHSAPDIRARSDTVAHIGTNGVWHVEPSTGAVAPASLATGAGVIVGIIDTGIDVEHPVFMKSLSPFATRIVSIWDQGLDPNPAQGEVGPPTARITNANTYGVEFTAAMIDNYLNNLTPPIFRHRDCSGHGTHVAATAAGNGNPGEGVPLMTPPGDFEFVGIAPRADIVVVKAMDVKDHIRDTAGNEVSLSVRVHDALKYILEVARGNPPTIPTRPAVINISFGRSLGPHDGLEDDEQFIDQLFGPTSRYHKGNILVLACGNAAAKRAHATVTLPASGEIVVPFELFDERGAQTKSYIECAWKEDTSDLEVELWYREVSAPADVSVAVRAPTQSAFSDEVFSGQLSTTFDRNKKRTIEHRDKPPVSRPVSGGTPVSVKRNQIHLTVEPNRRVTPAQHRTGTYEIRLKGPPGTVFQAWTYQSGPFLGFRVAAPTTTLTVGSGPGFDNLLVADTSLFSVGDPIGIQLDDGTLHRTVVTSVSPASGEGLLEFADVLPGSVFFGNKVLKMTPGIDINDLHLIASPAGARNAIAVAAYNDLNGKTTDPNYGNIIFFSSRGPLADYSGLGPLVAKPDIAAPGAFIKAAMSKHAEGKLVQLSWDELFGNRFVEMHGTSMAAPHITGVIALLLERKNDLTVDDVRAIFSTAANDRPGTRPTPADAVAHQNAYGGGMVDTTKALDAV